MAPKRYGYLKVLSTLGNRPAFMQHLLYNINTRHPLESGFGLLPLGTHFLSTVLVYYR